MQDYIMPANSKKSGLIMLILSVMPGALSVLLVFPVPNYHNVMQLITNIITFYTGRRKYEWKGWTVTHEE